eukprot:TRINITY_DN5312_c0_g1_i1.p1 TRINITY_DN5312_c0_g1~~TRINITY_DN5312_c0_g1_i1.p1  ORF type:complete len:143 (-),score=13.64 TRINITY_DN5312_c0_g1_i1:153-581(-)
MRAWQEFIELPEDVQEEIIYKSESKPAITPKSSSKDISPEESWRRIHRPTRQLLRRCKDTDFLTKFDSEIYILLSEYIGPLQQTFTFEHISDLYIATGVCDYYQLLTEHHVDLQTGHPVATINRCKHTTIPGGRRLIEFLKS